MEKKTIGAFIAALRKANGMTQQEVADRLNVSNKAVSRWERDECAPDLSLIPAIAEMFGVTCDELLKGERIFAEAMPEKSEPKVEKQLRSLINRTVSSFQTLIWLSLTLSVIGLICMFGISYGFYRPVIGFAVMMLFEAAAFVLGVIAVNRIKGVKEDNELFENADPSLLAKFNKALGEYSFFAFFAIISVIVLSIPLIMIDSQFVDSVLSFEDYLSTYFPILVIALLVICLFGKAPYTAWITEEPQRRTAKSINRKLCVMNCIQLGAVLLASILIVIAPYFVYSPYEMTTPMNIALIIAALVLFLANIVCFIVYMCKYPTERKQLLLPGIRNMLMIASGFIISEMHYVGFQSFKPDWGMVSSYGKYEIWDTEYLWLALSFAGLNMAIFKIIEILMHQNVKKAENNTDI